MFSTKKSEIAKKKPRNGNGEFCPQEDANNSVPVRERNQKGRFVRRRVVAQWNVIFERDEIQWRKFKNTSLSHRIAYKVKTTNMKRLVIDPPCGVLDPKEAVSFAITCKAFAVGQENAKNDRITVEWTNIPYGAAKKFRREWFQVDGLVGRMHAAIKYKKQ